MRSGPRVVLATFAGRQDRMELLRGYAEQAMRRGLIDDWHVWDFARTPQDQAWLRACFPAIRRTADDGVYRPSSAVVPPTATHLLRLEVRAGHDAHIALLADGGPSYEIVLGGWGNSAAAIRIWPEGTRPVHTGDLGPPDLVCPAPAVLSSRAWRSVEVAVTRDAGILALAVAVAGREVLRFADAETSVRPFAVAVMTGYGGTAEWRLTADRTERGGLFYAARDRYHPWNGVYQFYAARAEEYADTVFLKCDDDVVYMDVAALEQFIRVRRADATPFLLSANVVNNGVCGYVQQQLGIVPREVMALEMPPGGCRGSLWGSGGKAEALHRYFLADPTRFARAGVHRLGANLRLSINFVAWLGADLPHFETRFADDEQDLTVTLPRFLGRSNAICLPFVVSHLSFRQQDQSGEMDVPGVLAGYRALASSMRAVADA